MNRLIFQNQAIADLEKIGEDIAVHSRVAAERTIARLERATRLLRDYPRAGRVRDDIELGVRIFPVGYYLILFRALEDGAEIVRYVDGRRNPADWLP